MTPREIAIDPRFCGPPESGNGGYVAGRLAAFVTNAATSTSAQAAPAISVRLNSPPPLDTPLAVIVEEEERQGEAQASDVARLMFGSACVAEARASSLDLVLPEPPSFAEAERASQQFRGYTEHVFPGCFVCGTERSSCDGLCIFPGAVGRDDLFAAPWTPDASLAGEEGRVADEFLWAALDCPGAFAFPQPKDRIILLGSLQVSLEPAGEGKSPSGVAIGEHCVLMSWQVSVDGRKHWTASALIGADGGCRAKALGLWFEVEPTRVPRGEA